MMAFSDTLPIKQKLVQGDGDIFALIFDELCCSAMYILKALGEGKIDV